MSHLVSRILLAILMFPLATVFYVIVFVVAGTWIRRNSFYYYPIEAYLFAFSSLFTWVLVAVYWCLLWKSGVKWNSDRRIFTVLAAVVAVIVATVVALAVGSVVNVSSGFSVFVGGLLAVVLWLIGTVLIWRETAAERAARLAGSSASNVACPSCGYNLTGLSESRCPECGSKFTLNELFASQPNAKSEMD
jgi:uncharacterized paraquat-inducible protein A